MPRKTVAIVGASADRSKFGNKSVRAHVAAGYDVCPVNPRGGIIEGLMVYRSLSDVPRPLDRISLYVPPSTGRQLVEEIARTGCREVWLNPGSADEALVAALQALGIEPILGCSIVDLSFSPAEFPS
jgi:hypothetical protein